jgi:TIR domain/PDZ domain
MGEIFISYASEDRESARKLAEALSERGWSVWWDRKIPLGRPFDEVIEKALGESRCVIVLWSAVSVAKEWVRNEASEAKRRGILVPVFLEPVNAPLAFRLLNGADLSQWEAGTPSAEFDKLFERVGELLGHPPGVSGTGSSRPAGDSISQRESHFITKLVRSPFFIVGVAVLVITVLIGRNLLVERLTEPPQKETQAQVAESTNKQVPPPEVASLLTGFQVPDLGVRMAFITPEQSASLLGTLPTGAVVLEVESDHPVARAGMKKGDLVLSIGGAKISSEDDLRRAIRRIGPGKTQFSFRRGNQADIAVVDCPNCKSE